MNSTWPHPAPVGHESPDAVRQNDAHFNLGVVEPILNADSRRLHCVGDVHRLETQLKRSRVDRSQIEDVVDDRKQRMR